ncbi:MAG: hypothetical protein AB7S75_14110 [Desulfococcaceae bacterium]
MKKASRYLAWFKTLVTQLPTATKTVQEINRLIPGNHQDISAEWAHCAHRNAV